MISHTKKCIFIHIPKTGGTSITKCLHNFFDESKFTGHEHQTEYAKFVNLDDYYQFTIVRNPWDRICSAFFYIKHANTIRNNPRSIRDMDFLTFIKNKKYFDVRLPHYRPQCAFLDYNLKKVDVFKFENLNENFNIICNKIGVSGVPLRHDNKVDRKFYTEYYDEEAIEIVRKAYSDDIETFGYDFM